MSLSPVHAFVGRSDTGKSTLLRAMRILVHLASSQFDLTQSGYRPFDPFLPRAVSDPTLTLSATTHDGYGYEITSLEEMPESYLEVASRHGRGRGARRPLDRPTSVLHDAQFVSLRRDLQGASLLRFDADALREDSRLLEEGERVRFLDDRGRGLPGVLDAILNRGDDAFRAISERVRRSFPSVRSIRLRVASARTKALEIELLDGTRIPASQVSDSVLYYLAFAAVPYLTPVSHLFVDEPETGLHPARAADVVRILRTLPARHRTQVVIATHDSAVVNELSANEVTVVTRPDGGATELIPITDLPEFDERTTLLTLGDLWLSANDSNEH